MTSILRRRRTPSRSTRRQLLLGALVAAVISSLAASAPVIASPKYASFWGNQTLVTRSVDLTVPINVGTRFRTNSAGQVLGLRVYLMGSRERTNSVQLYDSNGRVLAKASFQATRKTGWREIKFPKPVTVSNKSTITAAAYLPFGHWAYSPRALSSARTNGPLTALNGVYSFTKGATYPSKITKDALLVDVMFRPRSGTVVTPESKPTATPTSGPTATATATTPSATTTTSTSTSSSSTTTTKASSPATSTTTSSSSGSLGSCTMKPSASNTGAQGSLKASSVQTIDKAGTVLENVSLGDDLRINADNVTIRNVKVNGTILVRQASGVTVEHVTARGVAVSGSKNVVVQYNNLSGGNDASGVTSDTGPASNITLQYNYIHSPNPSPTAHYDGTQVRGVDGLKILCSNYDLGAWESTYNAAVYMENANGGTKNVTVANNWLDGGGITLYVTATNLTVTGNKFGRSYHWAPCRNLGSKFSSSGNSWADTGAPLIPCG